MNGFIRPVRLDDAERVASIYNRYVSKTTITFETEPVPVEVMRGRIDSISSAFPYFVYEYDGELIGYCTPISGKSARHIQRPLRPLSISLPKPAIKESARF